MQRDHSEERVKINAERRRNGVQITKVITSNPKIMAIDQFRREHGA